MLLRFQAKTSSMNDYIIFSRSEHTIRWKESAPIADPTIPSLASFHSYSVLTAVLDIPCYIQRKPLSPSLFASSQRTIPSDQKPRSHGSNNSRLIHQFFSLPKMSKIGPSTSPPPYLHPPPSIPIPPWLATMRRTPRPLLLQPLQLLLRLPLPLRLPILFPHRFHDRAR